MQNPWIPLGIAYHYIIFIYMKKKYMITCKIYGVQVSELI